MWPGEGEITDASYRDPVGSQVEELKVLQAWQGVHWHLSQEVVRQIQLNQVRHICGERRDNYDWDGN